MNKYLIELLNEVNTVIIPGFGALTVVNRTKKEYMFMPYLKYDDGLLADFISKKENWPIGEAKDLISKYVNDISITLNKGGKYDFTEIGSFKKVEDEIVFDNWKEQSYVQPKETDEIQQTSVEPTIEEVKPVITEELEVTPTEVNLPTEEEETITSTEVEANEVSVEEVQPEVEIAEEEKKLREYFSTSKGDAVVGMVVRDDEETSETLNEGTPTEEEPSTSEEISEHISTEEEIIVVETPIEPATPIIEPTITPEVIEDNKESKEKEMAPEEDQWNDDCDVPPINYKRPVKKKPILEKTKKDKKSGAPAILWFLIGFIFIGGLTVAGFYWEDIKSMINGNDSGLLVDNDDEEIDDIPVPEDDTNLDSDNPTEQEIDTPIEDEKPEEIVPPVKENKPVEKPKPVTPPAVVSANIDKSKPFQVIVGSFAEEQNAQKLITKLKNNGTEAAIYGVINGMHMVTIGSFNSESEYQTKKAQLEQAGPQWLFKKK